MKPAIKTFTLCLVLTALAGILGSKAVAGNNVQDPGKQENLEHDSLDLKLLKDYYQLEVYISDVTYNFYDAKDNLIFTATLKKEENPGKELLSYLNKSTYLTDYEHTSYFRMNNQ